MRIWCPCVVAVLAAGCTDGFEVSVSHVGITGSTGSRIAVGVGFTDASGQPLDLPKKFQLVVDTKLGETGGWLRASNIVVDKTGKPTHDVILVADNSGSELGALEPVREAVKHFSHVVLASAHADRVGLVRVSTQATLLQPLTTAEDELSAAADELFQGNGWTALWDGVRLANDTLAAQAVDVIDTSSPCRASAYRSVVAFTDGADNNSADEHPTQYPGDGIATRFEDLLDMQIAGTRTSVFWVGVGDKRDEAALQTMALATGGKYVGIASYMGLQGALESMAGQLRGIVAACFTPAACDHTQARMRVTAGALSAEQVIAIPSTCGT